MKIKIPITYTESTYRMAYVFGDNFKLKSVWLKDYLRDMELGVKIA